MSVEIAWAAGLFEGEGSIIWHKRNEAPVLSLGMSDEDVVRRFQAVAGGTVVGPYLNPSAVMKHKDPKPMWIWRLSNKADIDDLFEALLPYLGQRRRARIEEVNAMYLASTKKRKPGKRTRELTRLKAV